MPERNFETEIMLQEGELFILPLLNNISIQAEFGVGGELVGGSFDQSFSLDFDIGDEVGIPTVAEISYSIDGGLTFHKVQLHIVDIDVGGETRRGILFNRIIIGILASLKR